MFNWEDLHYFMVFAREKSLSGAARSLQVDHATVARRIASLEASLQLKLVDRRPRSYLMTADGLRIAEQGDAMALNAFAVGRAALGGAAGRIGRGDIECTAGNGGEADRAAPRRAAETLSGSAARLAGGYR
ncbi:helix-turn-helix domain-containing protein [Serratia ficaria]|uniref:helix-turn-helix domain-containing protein n=1 Tax=Serratia ficaria TaxID=61651 RepID=UPI0021BA51E9|nr:LysR family transcriptional regulator [Serratia ficaria]